MVIHEARTAWKDNSKHVAYSWESHSCSHVIWQNGYYKVQLMRWRSLKQQSHDNKGWNFSKLLFCSSIKKAFLVEKVPKSFYVADKLQGQKSLFSYSGDQVVSAFQFNISFKLPFVHDILLHSQLTSPANNNEQSKQRLSRRCNKR